MSNDNVISITDRKPVVPEPDNKADGEVLIRTKEQLEEVLGSPLECAITIVVGTDGTYATIFSNTSKWTAVGLMELAKHSLMPGS